MKTTLLLALLLLSLNAEGASAARSAEDIATKKADRKEYQALWDAANRKKNAERQKKRRDDPEIGARIKDKLKKWRAAHPGSRKIEAEQQKQRRKANQEKIKAQQKAYRAANQEKINAQQKARRAAAKLKRASSWHVGGKPLFEVEPLGSDEDVPVDQASFAFGAGAGAHLDKPADKKRPRSDGADSGPATKPKTT